MNAFGRHRFLRARREGKLQLPYKMGLEVLEWIRQQSSLETLIITILSSSTHDEHVRRVYATATQPPCLT